MPMHERRRAIGVERIRRATINSWNGLVAVTRSQAAFRQELVLLALAVPLSFLLTPDVARRFALVGAVVLVLVVELLNTAIETLCDRVTREDDPAIRQVKDMGSTAVGISLLLAGTVWVWVLAEQFWP
jgi:diacylglycerol kinase (ATP)